MKVAAREKPAARELAYWYPFNVDQWYPKVKDLTFCSEFIHLSLDDARAMIDQLNENAAQIEPTLFNASLGNPLLLNLVTAIDKALASFVGHHAFVRLSSRSPKDAILGSVVDCHLDKEVKRWLVDEGREPFISSMHPLVYIASARALEVNSGNEALHLLLNSFRVLEDLNYYVNNPTVFPICITLREWVDIPPSMEFRGFVCENKFTALSQYFHESYFEDLAKTKKAVQKRIEAFWEESVKERLSYLGSYIVDFAVVGDKVWILELNPFDEYTGTGLFSWEGHNHRLREGPFKFAILKSPLTHGNVWINGKLRKSIERVRLVSKSESKSESKS